MLDISQISKSFDDKQVLQGVSFQVEAGEIIALLGPSGCGKTTLLRIIAGLETADEGQIKLDGQDLTDVAVYRRGFGMVFQDYALFPHKTAAENIAFGLRMADWSVGKRQERVGQLMELVGLKGMGARRIYDLSGGEQQRVALARALAPNPRLLLLDEPLGALDRALRERLMIELRSILVRAAEIEGQRRVTTIYVTHDQEEAFAIAGRVMVMNKGRIEQSGRPLDLYRSPETPFVARFLGMENLVPGTVRGERPCLVETDFGLIELDNACEAEQGSGGLLLIRPEAAEILEPGQEEGKNQLNGRIEDVSFRGRYQIVQVGIEKDGRTTSLKLTFDVAQPLPERGRSIRLALQSDKCHFYLNQTAF